MQQTNIKLEKERDLGETITDTFSFIRQNFSGLSQVFISTILPMLIISVAASVYYQFSAQEFSDNLLGINTGFDLVEFFTSLPYLLSVLSTLFFYVVSYLSILASMKSYRLKNTIDLEFVKSEIKSRFWSMTGLIIVSSIMLIISIILCVLPVFYMIVPVSLMYSILIFEDKSISESISDAFGLIRDHFWPTLGTILVIFIIVGLASGIFQIPVMLYAMFTMITNIDASTVNYDNLLETDWIMLTLTAIGNIGTNVLALVSIIATALIYFNLNEKQNLTGTAQEIDTIGSN
ncbi:hypothetical protein [Psychroflexus planctonicus]|uniref:Glycerophosphoryl diester phosphodiesterase membrane domain-containing protein n=1 Tax=Psychroflexus planctonicus TaxID=1526575 RepID=A0ABQ1SJJ3_9FLAO|nr:hypothetical protein [Psychroflexus planctonicus]GGE43185.1 hypothetical protein GCM10010832_23910 [Psychroflexus planctonicus]